MSGLEILPQNSYALQEKSVAKTLPDQDKDTSNTIAIMHTSTAVCVRCEDTYPISCLTQDELQCLCKVIKSKWEKAIVLVASWHGLSASESGWLQRADGDAKQRRITLQTQSVSAWY